MSPETSESWKFALIERQQLSWIASYMKYCLKACRMILDVIGWWPVLPNRSCLLLLPVPVLNLINAGICCAESNVYVVYVTVNNVHVILCLPCDSYAFNALTLLIGWQEGHPACKKLEWWDAGVVMCLGQGADLHMAQLMPLLLTISCSSKSRLVLPSWFYLSGASSPG